MLRRRDQSSVEPPPLLVDETVVPSLDEPFTLADRPAGVRFYKGRDSFFHPYALLQSARMQEERLILSYSTTEIIVSGSALHALYVHLTNQRVARIIEQGRRHAGASDGVTFVHQIEEILK